MHEMAEKCAMAIKNYMPK